jgi:excisionase family DNA binding protein
MATIESTVPVLMPRRAAAKRLGISERMVDIAVRQRKLRAVRIGNRVLLSIGDVEALAAADDFAS